MILYTSSRRQTPIGTNIMCEDVGALLLRQLSSTAWLIGFMGRDGISLITPIIDQLGLSQSQECFGLRCYEEQLREKM